MGMRRFLPSLLLLSLLLVAGSTATAASKPSYCSKAIKAGKGKRVAKVGGVTVFRRGQTVSLCSDKRRKSVEVYGMDPGMKIAKLVGTRSRCAAVLMSGKGRLPEILFKDLASKETSSSVVVIGYGQPAATVGSVAMASNCGVAWGESISDGATTSYAIKARGLASLTSVPSNQTTFVAAPKSAAGIAGVRAKASGKKLVVGWTEAGVKQSKTLPGDDCGLVHTSQTDC
jgi:hypothetical protein